MTGFGPVAPDLSIRRRQAELMDDSALDGDRHVGALRALARVNRVSGAGARVWREARALHAELGREVRILDVACGGGDVLADVATRARRGRVPVVLTGVDVSPVALDHARTALAAATVGAADPGVDAALVESDVLSSALPTDHDLVVSSLFLHHLDGADAVRLLRRMADAAGRSLLVQDLRRSRTGYLLAWLGLHTLTTSSVARHDGLVSVRAAFTMVEARTLCAEAGLRDAEVSTCWPQRFCVRWRRT